MEAESAARLTAEGELLYAEDRQLAHYRQRGCWEGGTLALLDRGDLRLGIREATKALFLGQTTANTELLALANRDLAYAYSLAGRLDRADEFANAAIHNAAYTPAVFARERAKVLGLAYKIRGDVKLRRGVVGDALTDYKEALAQGDRSIRPFVYASMANAYLAAKSPDKAREFFQKAEETAGSAGLRATIRRGQGEVALAAGNYTEALRAFEKAAADASGGDEAYNRLWALDGIARTHSALGKLGPARASYVGVLDLAEKVRARFRSDEFKTGFFGDLQSVFDRATVAFMNGGDAETALEVSDQSRSRALLDMVRGRVKTSEGAEAFADALRRPAMIQELRSRLPDDLAVIVYHVVDERSYAWVIRRARVTALILRLGSRPLSSRINSFRDALRDRGRTSDATAIGRDLYDVLITPLGLRPSENVVIVPHSVLHYLPFQALRAETRYLIEERGISYAPSASVLLSLISRERAAMGPVLALGNPDLGSRRFALPGAEDEVHRIKALFTDAEIYTQKEATKERLLARAPHNQLIHVGAHAEVDQIDPMYSIIRLASTDGSRGDLEAHEIYRLDLRRAGLVTLSACETGLGRVSPGDELWGFTRPFFAAGAQTLLVSLWPVDDAATARLMGHFYEHLRNGSAQSALRAAQLEVLGDPKSIDPFYWAPFVVVGDWR
jgi:CHAT domain-containing protein